MTQVPLSTDQRAYYAADLEMLHRAEGLFVGQLDDGELEAFNRLVGARLAMRSYEGGAGFMGLAKVRFIP